MEPKAPRPTNDAEALRDLRKRLGGGVLQWGLLALAAWCVAALPQYLREQASEGWPTVPGRIVESGLREGHFRGMKGYVPVVRYAYAVGGKELIGERVSFHLSESMYARDTAEAAIARYPVGREVAVRYEPGEPAFAVLEPGMKDEQRLLFRLAVGMGLAALIGFILVARQRSVARGSRTGGAR